MRKYLLNEKLPYLLTLLIGLIAYQFNNITADLASTPIIEYYFKAEERKSFEDSTWVQFKCVIVNLTKDESFRNIEISLAFKDKYQDLDPIFLHPVEMIPFAPAVIPSSSDQEENIKLILDLAIEANIPVLQPGNKILLRFNTTTKGDQIIKPSLYLNKIDKTVQFRRRSIQTLLVKYRIGISFILLSFLIITLIYYVRFLKTYTSNEC